jgi:dipeptidyl aminopeptidase/acylaminoacyl peptidase
VSPTQPAIFLVAHDANSFSILKIKIDDNQASLEEPVYQTRSIYPPSSLPPDEQALLSNCSSNSNNGCVLPNVALQHEIDDLVVSPDRDFLVWRESTNYCPINNCLVGIEQLILWNIAERDRRELVQVPLNVSYGTQHISDISWSPDSQYVSFLYASKELGWSRIKVIQITTSQIINTIENAYHYVWAPHSNRIAYIGWEYFNQERRAFAKIETLGDQVPASFYDDWADIRSLTWAPDEKRIAVIALKNQDVKTERWGLYIIDLEHQSIIDESGLISQDVATVSWSPTNDKISLSSYTKKDISIIDLNSSSITVTKNNTPNFFGLYPSWSPDGQIIAVNTYPTQDRIASNGIAFVNAQSGNVLDAFDLEGVSENWVWTSSGYKIALNLQNKMVSCSNSKQRGIGLYDLQYQKLIFLFFDKQTTNEISNCELTIDEIAQ